MLRLNRAISSGSRKAETLIVLPIRLYNASLRTTSRIFDGIRE